MDNQNNYNFVFGSYVVEAEIKVLNDKKDSEISLKTVSIFNDNSMDYVGIELSKSQRIWFERKVAQSFYGGLE